MAKLVKYFKGEDGFIPLLDTRGSVHATAEENCLVVWPESNEKAGLIITDEQLASLGYTVIEAKGEAVNKYFKSSGKRVMVGKTKAHYIVTEDCGTKWLFFNKPWLDGDAWCFVGGCREHKGPDYAKNYKQSLRKLYPV